LRYCEQARPIWTELRSWLDRSLGAAPPQSLTGKAINYLASEWPRLIRCLDDGRAPDPLPRRRPHRGRQQSV